MFKTLSPTIPYMESKLKVATGGLVGLIAILVACVAQHYVPLP